MQWADIEVPNDPVDRSSQGSSACYPRRTFYPLSDDFSFQNHRIIRSDNFKHKYIQKEILARHVCLAMRQAFTLTLHSRDYRLELAFELLRYSLGGDRPSQTSNHALFPPQGEISQKAESRVVFHWRLLFKKQLLSIPPILHRIRFVTIQRSSQGARGLSV